MELELFLLLLGILWECPSKYVKSCVKCLFVCGIKIHLISDKALAVDILSHHVSPSMMYMKKYFHKVTKSNVKPFEKIQNKNIGNTSAVLLLCSCIRVHFLTKYAFLLIFFQKQTDMGSLKNNSSEYVLLYDTRVGKLKFFEIESFATTISA